MRSTGPKTAAGKLKASRNAFRHGLSAAVPWDSATSAKVGAISRVLAGEQATEDRLRSAADFTRAQLELLRIRSIRAERLTKIDLDDNNLQELRRLVALDRHERYALTKRRRASLKF
jgi:hypothetical protein